MTKRIIKLLEDEMKKDPERYNRWYDEFQNFIKEGITTDTDNTDALLRVSRFYATWTEEMVSLEDYLKQIKGEQKNIYYYIGQRKAAQNSAFLESFKDSGIPVLICPNQIDELCFNNIKEYKSLKFVNVESKYEDISNDITKKVEHDKVNGVPEDEISAFSLWIKNILQPTIGRVTISKRLRDSPAVIIGAFSSTMRAVVSMMDQSQASQIGNDQTLEINPNHPFLVNLNKIRKVDPELAGDMAKHLLDSLMLQSGIHFDIHLAQKRSLNIMNKCIDRQLRIGGFKTAEAQSSSKDASTSILEEARREGTKPKEKVQELRLNKDGEVEDLGIKERSK